LSFPLVGWELNHNSRLPTARICSTTPWIFAACLSTSSLFIYLCCGVVYRTYYPGEGIIRGTMPICMMIKYRLGPTYWPIVLWLLFLAPANMLHFWPDILLPSPHSIHRFYSSIYVVVYSRRLKHKFIQIVRANGRT